MGFDFAVVDYVHVMLLLLAYSSDFKQKWKPNKYTL